ncbi:1c27fcfb-e2c7-493b-83d7-b6869657f777 [Thermothielavioides terrestris]|uniref:Uncharacterized protein n=2 Tax=Thermothielavioides terrestris TaxID=2587410 RepID=G2QRZ7_THETT|nr:uncharacterized protein THITE_2106924 [Thermothielavioides terrestris NRRL 8126]AEO62584.1 hypothetical protein THITE_2106924 [Thermothielavioides terrestris NRRL 8126]SPQ21921.1 1c27fcfb-e2c7-493b-83d7-b6869657f777 [Thermothielavioides terrestris]
MSSPQTPRHSPHPSLDFHSAASYTSYSPQQDRRQSKASSYNDSSMDLGISGGGAGADGGGGLGNLADELAGAFSDGEDDYDGYDDGAYDGEDPGADNEARTPGISLDEATGERNDDGVRDSGVDIESPSAAGRGHRSQGSLGLPSHGRGHRRKGSEYDGSEYGSESDLESPGMPPKLVEKIDEVESLARRGAENNGSPADGAFKRLTDSLRDLGSQGGIEGGASRLITAHSALTTHLSHQTRQLHNLTFPLLSPLVAPPEPETIDALLPMLLTLPELMPRPSTAALQSLSSLHALTADLAHTLNYLSDTLHMARQTTTTAARRLKSARDLVAELRRDEELRDEGRRWLDRGRWGERLARRECALVCGDVVGGFEAVCDSWRERLRALAEESAHA